MTLGIRQIINNSAKTKHLMLEKCENDIQKACQMMIESIKNGNKILWCGNGGSAADAQHMAAELMGGLRSHDRKPIPSIA
ncbi:MAG: SIS domain-containing protein, partial [Candidatus Neomarinimicrobiota bacterium]|nr:SIS domain-containing protein [Candidatus Neomarinimicrobiota bacterium]